MLNMLIFLRQRTQQKCTTTSFPLRLRALNITQFAAYSITFTFIYRVAQKVSHYQMIKKQYQRVLKPAYEIIFISQINVSVKNQNIIIFFFLNFAFFITIFYSLVFSCVTVLYVYGCYCAALMRNKLYIIIIRLY